MRVKADDVVVEHPVGSTVVVAGVATAVYVGIQLVLDGAVAPIETAVFVATFTAVYVGGSVYLRRRARDGDEGGETA